MFFSLHIGISNKIIKMVCICLFNFCKYVKYENTRKNIGKMLSSANIRKIIELAR